MPGRVVGIGRRPPSRRRPRLRRSTEPASPVRLKKPCAKRPSGSSISHTVIEPGRHSRHPRSTSRLRAPKPWAYGCWLFDTLHSHTRHHTRHVMAGPVPAIPMRKSAALQTIGITGTRPVMTWRAPSPASLQHIPT